MLFFLWCLNEYFSMNTCRMVVWSIQVNMRGFSLGCFDETLRSGPFFAGPSVYRGFATV